MVRVIVTGMHRTGTSALAGLLHHNGIPMGEEKWFIPKPLPENPKGFYEDVRFRVINDTILYHNHYVVKSFDPCIPDPITATDALRRSMKSLVESMGDGTWGFRDPRTCLTLHLWLEFLPDAKVVVSSRMTPSVVKSLGRHDHLPPGTARALIDAYGSRLAKTLREHDVSYIYMGYEHLLYHMSLAAESLSEFLGVPITDTTFLDTTLDHGLNDNN